MYQDAIDMLSGLIKTTPGLKGIKVNAHGKVDLVFSNKSVKVNNSTSMLEKIEDVKSNYHG
tara:strand:+ start:15573 stop:15755 length:183 start_codon:yes stop_codon:yes gene_type:complete